MRSIIKQNWTKIALLKWKVDSDYSDDWEYCSKVKIKKVNHDEAYNWLENEGISIPVVEETRRSREYTPQVVNYRVPKVDRMLLLVADLEKLKAS